MRAINDMRKIDEHKQVEKQLKARPIEAQKKYQKWKDIIALSGPQGLKLIKGFSDEALKGEWSGYSSSRLNKQFGENNMSEYQCAKKRIEVSVGKSVRIMRELQ